MHSLFYGDSAQKVIYTRPKKGEVAKPTLNDDALQQISRREPLLKPLINAISDIRTMGIFLSNFLTAPLDEDQRMRCAYNIGGSAGGKSAPKTYRLSSSENAFGSGTNLQVIPSEKSKSIGKAAARGSTAGLGDACSYPNIRSIFTPDPGYTLFDGDLDRADLQVVIAEAEDPMLKAAVAMGVDLHLMNAYVLQNKTVPDLSELVETHPKYPDWRRPMKLLREFARCSSMEPTTAANHALWLLIPDGLLQKLNALKEYGSVRILVSNGGMIELKIKLTSPISLRTDLVTAGTSLTEWIASSPKPSPGPPVHR